MNTLKPPLFLFVATTLAWNFVPSPTIAQENRERSRIDPPSQSLTEAGFSPQPIAPDRNITPLQFKTAQTPEEGLDLFVQPRFGGKFTTGPGIGYSSSFGSLYGFVPLTQTPGVNLAFAEGRFNIATQEGRLGGNLLVGYRHYIPDSDLVFGGYLAYDLRSTGSSTFNQIGAGLEVFGDPWEVRLNSYFPVSNTRKLVSERFFDRGTTFSNPRFVGNFLRLTQDTQTGRDRIFESALTGFDLEAGSRLVRWDGGDLRGYAGTYVYGGSGVSTFAGFRTRLVARPTPNLNLGLSLQRDRQFGTNLIFSFGATFGNSRPRGNSKPESVIARLGDSVARRDNIAIDRQLASEVLTSSSEVNATNPATGQPWFFRHVNLQGTGGSGTQDSPFNSIVAALTGVTADGNEIIYVSSPGTSPGFTIPANVQVLSSGPLQQLNTQAGLLSLPGSQSGNVPTINGTVTLNPNSILNGFNLVQPQPPTTPGNTLPISPGGGIILDGLAGNFEVKNVNITVTNPGSSGISCSNIAGVANLDISGTTITVNNPDGNGVRCTNVTGTVGISAPTQIATITTNNNQAAVFFQNNPGTVNLSNLNITANGGQVLEATTNIGNGSIRNSTLSSQNSNSNGLTLNGVTGTFALDNTSVTINNPTGNGINATNITGVVNFAANPGSTVTTNSANAGIFLSNSSGTINLSGLNINSTGGAALEANTVGNATSSNNTLSSTNSANNGLTLNGVTGTFALDNTNVTINNSTENGIDVTNITGIANLTANAGSQINNSTSFGAQLQNSTGTIVLSGFSITDAGNSGIRGTNISNLTVQNNTITRATNEGILLGNTNGTFNLASNVITDTQGVNPALPSLTNPPTGQGIKLQEVTGTVNITGNTITGTTGFNGNIDFANLNNTYIPSGQGIVVANSTGNINLNITGNNQIRNNREDAILIGLGDDPRSANLGDATANIDISGNTIENNGVLNVRGDGIGIGLEKAARINSLNISNNTISGNGDEGIEIRQGFVSFAVATGSTAQVNNATLDNNTIALPTNSNQRGINFEIFQGARLQAIVTNNTVTGQTPPNNMAIGVRVLNGGSMGGGGTPTTCLQVQNNTSNTNPGFFLGQAGGTFQLEGNTGQTAQQNIQNNNTGTATVFGGVTVVNPGTACP